MSTNLKFGKNKVKINCVFKMKMCLFMQGRTQPPKKGANRISTFFQMWGGFAPLGFFLITAYLVKKHLKRIQAEVDAACEKSILNKYNVFSKEITM